MDKADALRKIQKCLALANSPEPAEAARALAQAQKLMQQFGIEHPELLAAGVQTDQAKSRATRHPPTYEVMLANVVANSFGCDLLYMSGLAAARLAGAYRFIGIGPAPEVAAYTHTVLARKLQQARTTYTHTALRRHRKNKVAAADLFCEGWVRAVERTVIKPQRTPDEEQAITAWLDLNQPNRKTLKPTSRELTARASPDQHWGNGYDEGSKTTLHQGLGAGAQPAKQLGF